MPHEVKIPSLGESVSEASIGRWLKSDGEIVRADEPLLELESDKASMELAAESGGRLSILRPAGETVRAGEVVARIDEAALAEIGPGASASSAPGGTGAASAPGAARPKRAADLPLAPSVRRIAAEQGLDLSGVTGSGPGGRITKADVLQLAERREKAGAAQPAALAPVAQALAAGTPAADAPAPLATTMPAPAMPASAARATVAAAPIARADVAGTSAVRLPVAAIPIAGEPAAARPATPAGSSSGSRPDEERVPMSRLRQVIARRLVESQHATATLTTFNEIDMSAILELRSRHKAEFQQRHGVGLGFMSFFVDACCAAMREVPEVNARIDGSDVVYHHRVHVGVAVGSERGLVVPVVRDADRLSFAEIEREIARLAALAREGKLVPDDLSGASFTISNGGVYGSLLSTPILNPPQSAILGMHKIEKRPVVVDDQVVVRPMMYVALSYDHRLIDGKGAVTYLVRVKERLEDPTRLLLGV